MQITSIRYIAGHAPVPGGFSPAWWPGQHINGIYYDFVLVGTDAGITGIGSGRAQASAGGFADEALLREKLLGADPLEIGAIVDAPWMVRQRRVQPVSCEFALWDIMGKAAGLPVSKLLGQYKRQMPAYCSTGSVLSPEEHVAQAQDAYERGYRAIKLRFHRDDLSDEIAVAAAVREAMPDDMEIMVDANQTQNPYWSRATALNCAYALEELDCLWLEEPLPVYDVEGLARLCGKVEIPIAAGESQYQVWPFRRLVNEKAVDILQPDLNGCGGLLEWRKIAALAQAHILELTPHVWSNSLVVVQAMHAVASVPNAPWLEITDDMAWPADVRDHVLTAPIEINDGMVAVPDRAGWGVELDMDYVVANARVDVILE